MHVYYGPDEQVCQATKEKLKTMGIFHGRGTNENEEVIITKYRYYGMEFWFYNNFAFRIKGSIHKYINKGKHNYSILSYNSAIEALKDLCSLFDLKPNKLKIESFEFGLNLPISCNPSLIVEHIVQYNGRIPDIDRYGKTYKVFRYDDRDIKLYDKGLQCHLPYYLLRLEVRIKKLRHLDRITSDNFNSPIRTLADIIASDLSVIFRQSLGNIWSNMYLDESFRMTNDHPIRKKEKEMLMLAKEANYWREMKGMCTKEERIKELKGIYKKYVGVSLHDEIKEHIIK